MTIRYITEGDEFKARQLLGEARHQLSILKNLMGFQNLKQDQRLVRFDNGNVIQCISCFGQDVIKVFVPQQAEEVKQRDDIHIRYIPAIEVHSHKYYTRFIGVVLCRGGGFDPPYEFVPKDSLPEDLYYEEAEELREERIWYYPGDRKLEDIVPKGVASIDMINKTATISEVSFPGGFAGLLTNKCRRWMEEGPPHPIDYWRYGARSAWHYQHTRTENLSVEYGFSYLLADDPDPGEWPSYVYEGKTRSGGNKPGRLLNFGGDLYWTVQGSGSNDFLGKIFSVVYQDARKVVVDLILYGVIMAWHWERDDENVNFDTITALAESYAVGTPPTIIFPKRANFYKGDYNYSYLDNYYSPWDAVGSAMDENHYAFAYSLMHYQYGKAYNKSIANLIDCTGGIECKVTPADCAADADLVITNKRNEGPLNVVVDGVIFELFPETDLEVSPRLQECNPKYFRVGEKSIGLFYISKNYNDPLDYMYVYAHVTPEGKKQVVTEMPEWNAAIPGVTDLDGDPVYTHGGLRLIRETIIEE